MAFNGWQLGLHIQRDNIVIVALQQTRHGWALKRWWALDRPPTPTDDDLLARLAPWRRELPWQHVVRIAFPASRTLQKNLPSAAVTLNEKEQHQWIASAMSQQLEMSSDALCFDYHLAEPQGVWNVTAAQQHDVSRLQQVARDLRLNIAAITPDACALRAFLPRLPTRDTVLAWQGQDQWLWASHQGWGHVMQTEASTRRQLSERLGISDARLVCCCAQPDNEPSFDPWDIVRQKQPPLPARSDDFAVALALAMGGGDERWG